MERRTRNLFDFLDGSNFLRRVLRLEILLRSEEIPDLMFSILFVDIKEVLFIISTLRLNYFFL